MIEHDPLPIIDLYTLMTPYDSGEDEHAEYVPSYCSIESGIGPEDYDCEEVACN